MKIALSTDHAGFEQLKVLQTFLESQGHHCTNYGPTAFHETDDYPDFIVPAARAVASGEADCGIIMGGSGQGEAMAANRFKGIRAAVYYGSTSAEAPIDAEGNMASNEFEILRLSRQHNNANVLSLGARFLTEAQIEEAAKIWLNTPFSGVDRHARRNKKLDEIS